MTTPNDTMVICPACAHQFRAIPLDVQRELAQAQEKAASLLAANRLIREQQKSDWDRAEAAESRLRAAQVDAERLEFVLPVITGEDDAETNARTLALGNALMLQLDGRAAIDAAIKERSCQQNQ